MASNNNNDNQTRRFSSSTTALQIVDGLDLKDKTIAITGTTSGIGYETARALAKTNAHIVMFCRNLKTTEEVKKKILDETPNAKIDIIRCDINSLASVREAANEFLSKNWPLHILICNAGMMAPENLLSADGLETTFAVNHLGHFYLTKLLLPRLKAAGGARVVCVSSMGHQLTSLSKNITANELTKQLLTEAPKSTSYYNYGLLYGTAKLCNILFANSLTRKYSGDGIYANSLHPGVIKTNFSKGLIGWISMLLATPFTKSIEQGAATSVFCAVAPEMDKVGGKYLKDCWFTEPSTLATNEEVQEKLWTISEELISEFEMKNKK